MDSIMETLVKWVQLPSYDRCGPCPWNNKEEGICEYNGGCPWLDAVTMVEGLRAVEDGRFNPKEDSND